MGARITIITTTTQQQQYCDIAYVLVRMRIRSKFNTFNFISTGGDFMYFTWKSSFIFHQVSVFISLFSCYIPVADHFFRFISVDFFLVRYNVFFSFYHFSFCCCCSIHSRWAQSEKMKEKMNLLVSIVLAMRSDMHMQAKSSYTCVSIDIVVVVYNNRWKFKIQRACLS